MGAEFVSVCHWLTTKNASRKRSLVSIGTHDLDTVKGPFKYEARKPQDISFVPLNMTESFNGEQLMQKLSVRPLPLRNAVVLTS
jgi:4-alpha-glucanotransferase